MNLGKLTITSTGREDIVFVLYVENNDDKLVGQAINIKSMSTSDGINGFEAVTGKDLSLDDFIQKIQKIITDIDTEDTTQLTFNYVDSGEALTKYDLKVSFIYEEDIIPTYDEAAKTADILKIAAETTAKRNV